MHVRALPHPLRRIPTRADVERALRHEVRRLGPDARAPAAWTVWLSPYDAQRAGSGWPSTLAGCVLDEAAQLGLVLDGLVTVSVAAGDHLRRGRFQVTPTGVAAPPPATPEALPGRPRLVQPAGGTVAWGSAQSAGLEVEVLLHAGQHLVLGRGRSADVRLDDLTVSPDHAEVLVSADGQHVTLRDLVSTNGTSVDGVPTVETELVDGNRLELGEAVLVYHRGAVEDDGGRQGGETLDMIG